jgi:hypothetical protein
MKLISIGILLVGAILFQLDLRGYLLANLSFNHRAYRIIQSVISKDNLKDLSHSLVASVRLPVDNRLKQLRLFYSSKYSIKAALRSTITVSSTSITTITTALYCARIQNLGVTGACSRRRKELKLHYNNKISNFDDEFEVIKPTNVLRYKYHLYKLLKDF